MNTGYITVVQYNNPLISPRGRFWDTLEEARSYKSSLLMEYIKSVEIFGPCEINPAWIDANGLISEKDFAAINIGPSPT